MVFFGWKRKIGEKVLKVIFQQFEVEVVDEKDVVDNDEGNWFYVIKCRKEIFFEGCVEKSKQLKDEGVSLVENKRYWEVIQKWDEVLQLILNDVILYEMKLQVLMFFYEMFLVVYVVEMVVQ